MGEKEVKGWRGTGSYTGSTCADREISHRSYSSTHTQGAAKSAAKVVAPEIETKAPTPRSKASSVKPLSKTQGKASVQLPEAIAQICSDAHVDLGPLDNGESEAVWSSSGSTYRISRVGQVYSCSCPAW